jgi:nickel transport protein
MRAWLCLLALCCTPALAHEVKVDIGSQQAAVVSLTYADGSPFTFEAYEIYVPGKDIPAQVGRTNAAGQIVFLPGAQTEWRIKAYSSDGHGIDRQVQVAAGGAAAAAASSATLPRWLMLLAGLGIVFGIFGFIQLFITGKRQS